ncbi:MAG: chemotaxis protein MotB, partial [Deltaproteobacteria bacterium]|nr:chemotaxis protein MotB [Deltaproteobacteria bacterium]
MLKRLIYAALAGLCIISLSGCLVAESKYLKKVEEADSLTKNLSELQQKHEKLTSDNSDLKAQYEKLKDEASGLAKGNQALTADKKQLDDLLKAKSDTLSKNIS